MRAKELNRELFSILMQLEHVAFIFIFYFKSKRKVEVYIFYIHPHLFMSQPNPIKTEKKGLLWKIEKKKKIRNNFSVLTLEKGGIDGNAYLRRWVCFSHISYETYTNTSSQESLLSEKEARRTFSPSVNGFLLSAPFCSQKFTKRFCCLAKEIRHTANFFLQEITQKFIILESLIFV